MFKDWLSLGAQIKGLQKFIDLNVTFSINNINNTNVIFSQKEKRRRRN